MTWEETIEYIRKKPEYKGLVEKAYFEEDIAVNVERFKRSEEFIETLRLLKVYQPEAKTILDIGCGNGISAISFALEGYNVVAVEPDGSETIGAGAVRRMKEHYSLKNIEIHQSFAEDIEFNSEIFDVVYLRQAMHHANDLNKFIKEAGRVLKSGGILFTARDHVIFNLKDKDWFLQSHPLHKFYGGENAFTVGEYKTAMLKANLKILLELKHYDSIINYFPLSKSALNLLKFKQRLAFLIPNWVFPIFPKRLQLWKNILDEKKIPGRMYSYIAKKEYE